MARSLRERERERERDRERERERVCVCVWREMRLKREEIFLIYLGKGRIK